MCSLVVLGVLSLGTTYIYLVREILLVGEAHMMLLLEPCPGSVALLQCRRHSHNSVSVAAANVAYAGGFGVGTSGRRRRRRRWRWRWRHCRRCGCGCGWRWVCPLLLVARTVAACHIAPLQGQSVYLLPEFQLLLCSSSSSCSSGFCCSCLVYRIELAVIGAGVQFVWLFCRIEFLGRFGTQSFYGAASGKNKAQKRVLKSKRVTERGGGRFKCHAQLECACCKS